MRAANTADVNKYIRCLAKGANPVDYREKLDVETAIAEYIFLALRTATGLFIEEFNGYFKADFWGRFEGNVKKMAERGLVDFSKDNIRLTGRGMRYGNVVFASFLPDN